MHVAMSDATTGWLKERRVWMNPTGRVYRPGQLVTQRLRHFETPHIARLSVSRQIAGAQKHHEVNATKAITQVCTKVGEMRAK